MHSMKEVEFMDEIIRVDLLIENELDLLRFHIDEKTHLDIYLNSNEQNGLRVLYRKLIEICLKSKVVLNLNIDPKYDKVLFKEIATEFIKDLGQELDKVSLDVNFTKKEK